MKKNVHRCCSQRLQGFQAFRSVHCINFRLFAHHIYIYIEREPYIYICISIQSHAKHICLEHIQKLAFISFQCYIIYIIRRVFTKCWRRRRSNDFVLGACGICQDAYRKALVFGLFTVKACNTVLSTRFSSVEGGYFLIKSNCIRESTITIPV